MQLNYKLAIEAWAQVKKQQLADGSEAKQQKMLMKYQQAFEGQKKFRVNWSVSWEQNVLLNRKPTLEAWAWFKKITVSWLVRSKAVKHATELPANFWSLGLI